MEIQMFSSSLGAMGSLLGKLRSLLVSPEDQLPVPLKPHKDKLEQLEQDLEEINTLLMDLSKGEDPNTMAKLWMNEVRDLSYDIEDSVDKTMRPNTYTGEEIPFEVEEFHTLVKQASDARKRYYRYNLGRWASNPTFGVDGRARVVPNMDLVGIGDSRDKLVNLIGVGDEAEQRMKVVSVLGPVGVGKTTLAKEVYRQIRGKFECRAFVRASKMPDTRRLLRNIISQVQHHHRPSHGLPVQELIDNLRKHLQQKRYLILIDGLWETTSWDIVNSAFPEGNHCSRILITTDIEEVALDCCDYQSEGIFKMELLSRNNSRVLLFNKMFGPKHECSEALKEASEEVVQNCGGLPLATICIAGILASQPDNSELWQSVNERLSCCMRNNLTSEDMLREIISMSYNSLSNHLKTCLLYLSMYPEGYTFLKTDLVKQWSAEGFISAVEGKDNSEVAEFYFDDLVCRGLVQPNCIDFSDEVMFYTVHSTVFEVLRCKSMEENFTTVIDYSEAITKLSAKVRRLSLTFSSAKYATKPEGIALSEVRSLTFYGLVKCLPSIIEFKLLRVLILEFWGDKEELDMGGINKLFQLRYLQITTDMTIKLPASMQELIYLETIEMYARIVTFPSDAFDLPRLWHLCLQDVVNLPDGIGHMRSLRTLQSFDLSRNSSKNVRSLNELTNLRDLHLTCSTASFGRQLKRNLLSLVFSLEKLGNLKSIVLAPAASCTSINFFCADNVSLPVSLQRLELLPPICIFPRLPLCIGQLQKLRSLKIVLRELTRSDIYSMGRLQELTILSLYVWRPTAGFIVFSPGAFPVLKSFKFRCGIMRLGFQADAIPSLQRLKLEFNAHTGEKNANVLAGIEHLLNLQELTGRIGAAPGAEESDRKAAEALFKDTIIKQSRLTSFNLRIVHLFDKETSQFASTPASCTTSDCKHKWPSMDDGIGELNKGAVVQEFSSFCNASSTSNLDLPKYQASVTEPWNHPLASEPLDAWPMEWPMGSLFQLPIPPTHGSEQQLSKDKQPGDNMPSHSQNQLSDDGYRWHMYGEEVMNKGSRNVRSYYWCTFSGCAVRKNVERSQDGQQIVEIMYDGTHNHAKPHDTSRGGSGSSGTAGEQLRRQSGAAGSEASGHTFGGNNNSMIPARSPRSGSDRLDEHDRDPKKWRKDGDDGGISIAGKRVREPRVITQTMSDSDIIDDGFRWRKYGQKDVKGGNPRSYYRCTTAGCPARKHVERASHDQRVVITTYKGKHNHIAPPAPGDS